jgi:hypothetical protein
VLWDSSAESVPQLTWRDCSAVLCQLFRGKTWLVVDSTAYKLSTDPQLFAKVSAARQQEGERSPVLITEFGSYAEPCLTPDQEPQQVLSSGITTQADSIPAEPKVGSATSLRNSCGEVISKCARYDMFRIPEHFTEEAMQISLPFDFALTGNEMIGLYQFFRCGKLASDREEEEEVMPFSMHPDVEVIMKDKRIRLVEAMLKEAGCFDAKLPQDMTNSFAPTGFLQPSGQLPARLEPPSISKQDPRKALEWFKHSIDARTLSVIQDPEFAEALFEETLNQARPDEGWLGGPLLTSERDAKYHGHGVASRRVGALKDLKVREVDDFSVSGVNSALSPTEKLSLGGLDELIAPARAMVPAVHVFRSSVAS